MEYTGRDLIQDPDVTKLERLVVTCKMDLEYWKGELKNCKSGWPGWKEQRVKIERIVKEEKRRYLEMKEYFEKMTVGTGVEDPANHYREIRKMKEIKT